MYIYRFIYIYEYIYLHIQINYKMQGAADSTYITLKIDLGGAIGSKPLTLKVFTSNTIEEVHVILHSEHPIQINDTNM